MIRGGALRVLMSTGSRCRTITRAYLENTASSSSFPKVASYHRTAITTDLSTSDNNNNDRAVEEEDRDRNVLYRKNIAEVIARDFNISMNKAEKIVISAFNQISETLADGKEVSISRFGTFSTAEVKERNGRNPRTGESITIPAGLRVKFTAFQGLKERIKGDNKAGESK